MARGVIRIGTRGSALALTQARQIQASLEEPSKIAIIRTTGDRRQDVRLDLVGGVGLFTREIERALLAGEIDLAVHSLKDLPVEQPEGLVLGAIPQRVPVSDLLLVHPRAFDSSQELPVRAGARVGTSSTRRIALLAGVRSDLEPVALRGNVPTRLRKCVAGECDAVLLAQAGLQRLRQDLGELRAFQLHPAAWPCAPGQGALGLEVRQDDEVTKACLAPLDHPGSRACVTAERRLLQISGGGCHSAFGAWAELSAGCARIHLALLTPQDELRARCFEATDLGGARDDAGAWLEAGAPAGPTSNPDPEAWLCRPAPVWS